MDIFTPFTHRQHLFLSQMEGFLKTPTFENVITVEGNIGINNLAYEESEIMRLRKINFIERSREDWYALFEMYFLEKNH